MTPERWRQVKDVLASALEQAPERRQSFLAAACGGDTELRAEVESLILADGHELIPADPQAPPLLEAARPRLDPGARLGPYEVHGLLAVGGMGEVYRARDPRLGREVALKILPRALTADADRVARLEREARLLAALNHPNIAAIYGFEEAPAAAGAPSLHGLVMEFVAGRTLAETLAGSRLSPAQVVAVARQVADALDAAHEKGIVHRDLKPANIKITPGGVVKVLDFGLAKAVAPEAEATRPRAAAEETREGVILGTAAYMSPEQARGQPIDKRTDIWAFGCVVYEMLAGRAAFARATVTDTLAAVVEHEPDWAALPAAVPPRIRRLLRRCLEKDPKRRLRDVADARLELDDGVLEDGAPAATKARRGHALGWIAAGLAVAAAAALGIAGLRTAPSVPAPPVRFVVAPPAGGVLSANTHQFVPTVSPDGRRMAFVVHQGGASLLWVRSLDALEAYPVAGTEDASYPFWSPDSRTVGFFVGNTLKTVDAAGGKPRTLCNAPGSPNGGAWSPAGVIVFAAGGLFSIPVHGGVPTPLSGAEGRIRYPTFLPDGRRFLYWVTPANTIWLGSLDSSQRTLLLAAESQAAYAAPGWLLFMRQGTLLAQRFDAHRALLEGPAAPVAEDVLSNMNVAGAFSASQTGTLVYRTGTLAVPTRLRWVDRAGRPLKTVAEGGRYRNPSLSPDGTRVAVEMTDRETRSQDVWLLDLSAGAAARFTFDTRNDIYPVWSPDGAWIMFGSDRGGVFNLYRKRANGTGSEELVYQSQADMVPFSWTPDGRAVIYRTTGVNINMGILWLEDPPRAEPFLPSTFNVTTGVVAPDGRWVAYQSFESSHREIYVQSFPVPGGGKWQISREGGVHPRWRGDGRELFYYGLDGRMMAVPVTSGAALEVGAPVALFQPRLLNGTTTAYGYRHQYDVAADGQTFLLNEALEDVSPPHAVVVLGWRVLGE